jgi:hypothetical protein
LTVAARGAIFPAMPRAIPIAALLLLGGAAALPAQTDYYMRLGVTGATTLVHDQIVSPLDAKQSLAPTLVLGGSLRVMPHYGLGLEAALTSGGYDREENGSSTRIGTLRTLAVLLDLDGPLYGPLRWRAGVGTMSYLPADKTGIFSSGGTTRWLVGAGVDYRRRAFSGWDLLASARYDYHTFTTDALRARNFGGTQQISRIGVSVGLARGTP